MVICRLGKNTIRGKISVLVKEENQLMTPLQQKLEILASQIGKYGVIASVLTFLVLFFSLIYKSYIGLQCFWCLDFFQNIVRNFIVSLSIIVMAVPEGLPLCITLSLAYSVNIMFRDFNLVKKLSACEVMGAVTDVCSDKTGTITTGTMNLQRIIVDENIIEENQLQDGALKNIMINIIKYTSKAIIDKGENGEIVQKGNLTEIGLLKWIMKEKDIKQIKNIEVLKEFPFTSITRYSASIVKQENKAIIYLKGLPTLIEKCSQMLTIKGEIKPLSNIIKAEINQKIEQECQKAFRVLILAYKPIEKIEENIEILQEQDYILVTVLFLRDQIRPEVAQAVQQLAQAGICTRMITGDNKLTAKAIGQEVNIIPSILTEEDDDLIITGNQLETMENVDDILKYRIVASCNPFQKHKFVKLIQDQKKIVAVTGDGNNDALCFKSANVSFAMGIKGTEMVKENADIILLNDNFASIVTSWFLFYIYIYICLYLFSLWGRNIYQSVRKFITFQITVNVVAIFMTFFGSLALQVSPFNSSQILWVNLIMDTFASLALATDKPIPFLMQRGPFRENERILNGNIFKNILFQAVYQICILIFVVFAADDIFQIPEFTHMDSDAYNPEIAVHITIFFHTFILLQFFNELNCRNISDNLINPFERIFDNFYFLGVMVIQVIIQYVLVEYGGQVFGCSPLNFNQHVFCLFLAAGGLVVGILIKFIKKDKIQGYVNFISQEEIDIFQANKCIFFLYIFFLRFFIKQKIREVHYVMFLQTTKTLLVIITIEIQKNNQFENIIYIYQYLAFFNYLNKKIIKNININYKNQKKQHEQK
ncbi:hypothetical protein IMG5_182320 [Ichthyophthirius multifiliis]|uniref:Cation-transporting P-type ATPase C-terminal domain-containing protein n=1 Tax=Ichthyophthirius multifiliis TaxID=5932 RepID=G0R316_ICHMU|nr:hypothetical protein IMG5_182320 [Ichthyophthirius multifiliis]EGR28148.1 hypothetical protein IMG5_182320 [Ichthyophthirius multifiliis]|eukprot:XP_004027493.1 hypothetical protein IMG5_182320 [Ichthyophthirius multifiliis]